MKRKFSYLALGAVIVICLAVGVSLLIPEQEKLPEDLTLSDYPKLFNKEVVIVIGENATQMEIEGAEAIAENLYYVTGNMPVIKTDAEITEDELAGHNLIVVGGADSNAVLEEVYDMTDATRVTDEYPGEGKGVLEILRSPWDPEKAMLLVAGSDGWGVKAGSERLVKESKIFQGGKTTITEWIEGVVLKENETYMRTWEPGEQEITQDVLKLEHTFTLYPPTEQLFFVIKINDDDYNAEDYFGMVFDKNQNNLIDLGHTDEPYGLWVCNTTVPAALLKDGFLVFAQIPPRQGSHHCTFDSNIGYTLKVVFSKNELNFKNESMRLHLCFYDRDALDGVTTDITIHLQDFNMN